MTTETSWLEEMSTALDENMEETKERMEGVRDRSYNNLQEVRKERAYGFIQEDNVIQKDEEQLSADLSESMNNHDVISKFYVNRSKFSDELREAGLTPITILPKPLWMAFCKRYGIYNFDHIDKQGRVEARFRSGRCYLSSGDRQPSPRIYWGVGAVLVLFVAMFIKGITLSMLSPTLSGFVCGSSVVLGVSFLFALSRDRVFKIVTDLEDKWEAFKFTCRTRASLYKELWPNGTDDWDGIDTTISDPDSRKSTLHRIKLKFPNAPKSVMRIIGRVGDGYRIHISAQAESFVIDGKDFALALEAAKAKEMEAAKQADPIIYVQSKENATFPDTDEDCLVAILAQYGDFPKEKEAIEWARHNNFFSTVN